MSYPWMLVRGASANPSSLKFAALMNKQNLIENETFKPESVDIPILSTHTEDLVLLQDPFSFQKLKPNTIHYKGPFEPDGVNLKYWCRFNHISNHIDDKSFTGNVTRPEGSPRLCAGPDDGVKGGTIVTRINYKPENLDYFKVLNPDETLLGINEITTGLSMYLEFMVEGDPVQHNGEDPTIWFHVDDPTGDNGTIVRVGENRELKFFIKRNGTTFDFISANNVITPGTYHTACLTYNDTGDAMVMRVDNIPQTDSASESPIFPSGVENNIFLGIGTNQNAGRFVGRFKDFRWYRNLVFSNSQMDNIWNNKRSISPIPYGELAVAAHSRFHDTTYTEGFDSTGYDSTGYDTS